MKRGGLVDVEKMRSPGEADPTREPGVFDHYAALALYGLTHEGSGMEREA